MALQNLSPVLSQAPRVPQTEASAEDWAEFERLCTPGSPDFILDVPDYYAFFTYSLFRGRI